MIYDFSLQPIDERMYIICEQSDAIIIDPFINDEVLEFLAKKNIRDILVLLTHEHFDHITGVSYFVKKFNARVICSKKCSEGIQDVRKNLSARFEIFYLMNPAYDREEYLKMCSQPFVCEEADEVFENNMNFLWNGHKVEIFETPGHSAGSCCIYIDEKHLFTGDSLVNGFETITRYPGGSKEDYVGKTVPFLKGLDKNIMVYPGHGDRAELSEWNL